MSEVNILNPDAGSDYSPDFGFVRKRPVTHNSTKARSGKYYLRDVDTDGHTFDLYWKARPKATMLYLKQFDEQYRSQYFTYIEQETGRHYVGRFSSPLDITPIGYENWQVHGLFQEMPGCPMVQYPIDWDNEAIWVQEADDFGDVQPAYTGVWNVTANAAASGGKELLNAGNNAGDFAQLQYFGYGFRFWASKAANRGQFQMLLDGTLLNAPGGGTTFDLYAAATIPAQIILEYPEVPLGMHRVKVLSLNSKNGASSAYNIVFDALQVMR